MKWGMTKTAWAKWILHQSSYGTRRDWAFSSADTTTNMTHRVSSPTSLTTSFVLRLIGSNDANSSPREWAGLAAVCYVSWGIWQCSEVLHAVVVPWSNMKSIRIAGMKTIAGLKRGNVELPRDLMCVAQWRNDGMNRNNWIWMVWGGESDCFLTRLEKWLCVNRMSSR